MADPVSAEPQNWDNDILMKISMPGKHLRETTLVKMQRAEERFKAMQSRAQPSQTPVIQVQPKAIVEEKKPEPMQTQLTEMPVPSPATEALQVQEVPKETACESALIATEPSPNVPKAPSEPAQQEPLALADQVPATTVQEAPQVKQEPEEVDLLTKLANPTKTPAQEWKQEMIKRTSDETQKPKIDPAIIVAQRRPEEKKPEFYTNYPGLEMKEKYKVWTIEPPRDDAPPVIPANSVNTAKVENVANKIIGGDWVLERLRKN